MHRITVATLFHILNDTDNEFTTYKWLCGNRPPINDCGNRPWSTLPLIVQSPGIPIALSDNNNTKYYTFAIGQQGRNNSTGVHSDSAVQTKIGRSNFCWCSNLFVILFSVSVCSNGRNFTASVFWNRENCTKMTLFQRNCNWLIYSTLYYRCFERYVFLK